MNKLPHVFIFIGRSGAGKGVQVQMLQEYLKKHHPEFPSFYIYTGAGLREFMKGPTHTQQKVKQILDEGGIVPSFISSHVWTHMLVQDYDGAAHLITDGTPRKLPEAIVLDTVFDFYELNKPNVVYLNISEEEAKNRLLGRGRFDDTSSSIAHRLQWFEKDVEPILEWYKKNERYNFHDIDGVGTPEEIHQRIIKACNI